MKYVNYDTDTGKILGYYDSVINEGCIPDTAVEITDIAWKNALDNNYNHYSNGTFSKVDFRTDDEIAQAEAYTEYEWTLTELDTADTQVNYYIDEDESRQTATLGEWKAYRRALRDYVTTSTDDDGDTTYTVNELSGTTYTISDVEYSVTVDDDGRPIAPSDDDDE